MVERLAAMMWWNNLTESQRSEICGPNRNWKTLTGREIQELWLTTTI